ncbi:MAG TPA: hypothetical protein VFF75_06500 [Methylophilaceae bacterium]|nr:hypothetical protein [Methylophilaceae bacterium]
MKQIYILTDKQLIALLTLTSVLLTTWIMYLQHGWITEDSILYFEVARLFSIGEWKNGFAMYGWPLYPALIAALHKATGLGIQSAAQAWNIVFFALTTYSFLTFIRLAGGNRQAIIGGGLLLFSAPYIVGDILPMLLRDQGFWGFFLLSLGFLLSFHRTGEFKYALYWQISIIIAMLFRIEAFVYLLLAPLFMFRDLTKPFQSRLCAYGKTQILTLAAGSGLSLLFAISPTLQLRDLGRIRELITTFSRLHTQLTEGLAAKAQLMGDLVLGKYLDDYGMLSILLALVSIIIAKIIGATGVPAMLMLAMPQFDRLRLLRQDARELIIWILAIGVVIATIIILNRFILSSRYLAPLAFMLLILAVFTLSGMWDHLKTKESSNSRKQFALSIVLLLLCINLIKNLLPLAADHNFEQTAVAWVKEISPSGKTVFISDAKLRYYAGQPYDGRADPWKWTIKAINDGSIYRHDYLVVSLSGDKMAEQKEYLSTVLTQYQEVNEFSRESKKLVVIYKKTDAAS